jgi:hypothetical protein
MNPLRFNKLMLVELETLRREGLIDGPVHQELAQLYPVRGWDFSALGRWFLVFGAISAATGMMIMGSELFEFTLPKLAAGLALVSAGLFYAGFRLRASKLVWTRRSLELIGAIGLIGLTFTLGVIYSSGSGNWPALLLIDLLLLLPLSYLLRNVLLLVLTVIVFFTWFGGVTGYVSAWGAYWFSMNYPLRFLLAGLLIVGMSLVHRGAEQDRLRAYEGFFKVWLSAGLFFSEMALWLMSLFGNFGRIFDHHLETAGELILFNLLWAGFNVLLLVAGSRFGLRMMRGYAVTYLIIQAYTLYFWQVARHLDPILATFAAGAATLWIVIVFERRRRARPG